MALNLASLVLVGVYPVDYPSVALELVTFVLAEVYQVDQCQVPLHPPLPQPRLGVVVAVSVFGFRCVGT